jgi:flagellum-specific ATP synthase
VGIYQSGSNPELDKAILAYPQLTRFLRQDLMESVGFEESTHDLETALNSAPS